MNKSVFSVVGLLAVVVAVIMISVSMFRIGVTQTHYDCVVIDKDSVFLDNHRGNQYRVYTENCGVFSVEDEPLKMRFNSADIYSKINVGETYNFETVGWRIPLASMFPNIMEVR